MTLIFTGLGTTTIPQLGAKIAKITRIHLQHRRFRGNR